MEYRWNRKMTLIVCIALALCVIGCSSDDDPTDPGGGGDTTAPRVANADPLDGTLMVLAGTPIVINFNEAMDPATSTGQITLSHGTVDNLTWTTDMNLTATVSGWPAATRVTVTVGTGLKDVAGNALAAPVALTYGTWSENLFVFGTTPTGGAGNINRAAPLELDFGSPMIGTTIEPGITISDPSKALIPYTASSDDDAKWILDPTDILPANTEITVTIGTSVMSTYETSFPAPLVFSFTTGDEVDNTPPTIVSLDPPSGSVMPSSQQYLTITFSEPIDQYNFRPTSMNGQFMWLLFQVESEPSWNPAGDVFTVTLPDDLPAGLSLEAVFAGYSDLAGNIQTGETAWDATVAGTAAPFPVADGKQGLLVGEWAEGLPGSDTPTFSGPYWVYTQFTSRQTAGHWNDEDWYDPDYLYLDSYEILTVTGSSVNIIGFTEEEGGEGKILTEYFLSEPVPLVELPFTQGNTWTATSSATLPDGTMNVDVAGEVVGMTDLAVGLFDGIEISWTDVWKVNFAVDISSEGVPMSQELTETWYAPGVGVVREKYRQDSLMSGEEGWSTHDLWQSLGFDQ